MNAISEKSDAEVVEQYGKTVYRLAFAQLRSREDADDVFQEVFLKYVAKSPDFESEEHRRAWLLRVTNNCCRDFWRAPWRNRNVPLDENLPFETRDELGLHVELKKLPAKYRAVLHLFYYEGLSTKEIADIMKIKPAAVRQRLSRARSQLKETLGKELYDV